MSRPTYVLIFKIVCLQRSFGRCVVTFAYSFHIVFNIPLLEYFCKSCHSFFLYQPYNISLCNFSCRGKTWEVCTVTLSHHNKPVPILFAGCQSSACIASPALSVCLPLCGLLGKLVICEYSKCVPKMT